MNKSVSIITDLDGSKIALINDIRFKSRKGIDWNEVEQYLKEYIGEYFEISETSEKIYIGSDFPDEFSHSNDTKGLKGANMKAKANITPARISTISTNTASIGAAFLLPRDLLRLLRFVVAMAETSYRVYHNRIFFPRHPFSTGFTAFFQRMKLTARSVRLGGDLACFSPAARSRPLPKRRS